MPQGKQLPPEKIATVAALQQMGKGGRQISRATGLSRSTVHKYVELTPELRDSKRSNTIDRSWQIIEMADQIIAQKIEEASAKDAAIIGKIQTDRLLDLTNPQRNGANVVQVGGDIGIQFIKAGDPGEAGNG